MKYYIDESGSTGDLIMTQENLNFSSQEYFTLACIGLEEKKLIDLENYITELKKKYKIQNKELKFGNIRHIFGKKIGFILELLHSIEDDSNILIEITDKKYIIATNIVHTLVNPPYYQPQKSMEEEQKIHQLFSQWIYDYIPNEFFIKFSHISRNPSEEGLNELFDNLSDIINNIDHEMSKGILANVKESKDDYKRMKKEYIKDRNKLKRNKKHYQKNKEFLQRRKPYTFFLPLPDKNKRGELIGILPHIASFTNLLARLNTLHNKDLSSVTIIHDNHAHFDKIIEYYHKTAMDDTNDKNRVFEMANFNFKTIPDLEFQDDKNQIGLQIADIFAGLINKAIPFILKNGESLEKKEYMILIQILANLYSKKSINFVIPINQNKDILFPIFEMHLKLNVELGKDKFENDLLGV